MFGISKRHSLFYMQFIVAGFHIWNTIPPKKSIRVKFFYECCTSSKQLNKYFHSFLYASILQKAHVQGSILAIRQKNISSNSFQYKTNVTYLNSYKLKKIGL